jgi:hypothetical protein
VRGFGIQDQTSFGVAAVTVEAISAGDVEREHNAVAFLDALYGLADFIDHAHDLVTDDGTFFQGSAAVVHVQVAATDSGGCDAENRIGRGSDFWLGLFRNGHLPDAFVSNCLHRHWNSFVRVRMFGHVEIENDYTAKK